MELKKINNIDKLRAALLDVEKLRSALLNIGEAGMDQTNGQFDEFAQSGLQVEAIIVGTYNNMLILQVAGSQARYISVICDNCLKFRIGERINLDSSELRRADASKNIYTYSKEISYEHTNKNSQIDCEDLSETLNNPIGCLDVKEVSRM